jgi:transposase
MPKAAGKLTAATPCAWDGDLLSGAKNSHIATLVERRSRFVVLVNVGGKHSDSVVSPLIARVKTDPVDVEMLARMAATLQPDLTPVNDQTIDTLKEFLGARRALVKDRTATLNRSKGLTLALLKHQSDQHLKQIRGQIEAIDRECRRLIATHPTFRAGLDILVSIPGLGAVTAFVLLIDMPELGSMDTKQAASLAGLAPVTGQSGRWRGKSYSQGGRAILRQAIYMPTLVAIRFNPPLKIKYDALRAAGKPGQTRP